MLEAPPSRYKIVERNRRLITIDTQTGEAVGSAPGQVQGLAPGGAAGAALEVPASPAMRTTNANMGGPARGQTVLGAGRSGSQSAPAIAVASPRGMLAMLADLFPRTRLDAEGRITLTTAPYYDADAPRQMRLTKGKTDTLGIYVIALGLLALFVVSLVIMTDMIFGAIILVFVTIRVGDPVNKTILRYLISDAEPIS